jgi:glyoxylase-like metal-dependent hydrolase (beta-lactamase superfamily II)
MIRTCSFTRLLALFVLGASVSARSQAPAGPRYVVHDLGHDVYAVVFNPELEVEGNTLVVVNNDNVLVVDANAGLTTARLTISEIRKITPKPVRYVINTHWHDDHVMGNQAYAEAYPGVEFIAHPATRVDIVDHTFANNAYVIDLIDADLTRFDGYLATGIGRDGKPMTPEQTERVRAARRTRSEMATDRRAFRAAPPTIDVAESRTLTLGGRRIDIRFLGRGNTRGDLVVHLPAERIVATGDLIVWPVPYATNAYVRDWVGTLERLMQLPAETIVPGHGPVMKDWSYVQRVMAALEQASTEVAAAKKNGLGLDETTKSVQLADVRAAFLDGKEARALSFEVNFRVGLVRSLWEELDADVMKIYGASTMTRQADGLYRFGPATGTGLSATLATLVLNEKDVVLVSAARSAPEARALVRATRELTDRPIRLIVNTADTRPLEAITVFENVYGNADVIGYKGAKRALAVTGDLTLHRGKRTIVIREQRDGKVSVRVSGQEIGMTTSPP